MVDHTQKSPHDTASWLSRASLAWLVPIVRGTPPEIDEAKLSALPVSVDIERTYRNLKAKWQEESKSKDPKFIWALVKSLSGYFTYLTVMISIGIILPLFAAVIVGLLIDYLNDDDGDLWYGLCLVWGLFVCCIVSSLCISQYLFWGSVLGSITKLAGIQLIYDKVFRLSYSALHGDDAAGKIVTLAAKDLEAYDKIYLPCMILTFPFFIVLAGMLLWWKLGIAGLAALFVSILFVPMQLWFSHMFSVIWEHFSNATDKRVNLITDIIEGIKVLKLYHWETPYQEMNREVREKEISHIRKASYFRVSSYSLFLCGQGMLLAITYSIYVGLGNELKFENVFVGMAIITHTHLFLSSLLAFGMEYRGIALAASKRITESLLLPEKETESIAYIESSEIKITDLAVSWTASNKTTSNESREEDSLLTSEADPRPVLNGINLHVQPGQLCVVLGQVGAGKTSLLNSLLGELHLVSGNIVIGKNIAYVEQDPWILSATIKENIIMDEAENPEKYWRTVEACCLIEDFKEMAHEDQTMIGDKGVNLSGGQKARIALARAVYTSRDIYLLDDPLSAVDAAVSSKLFTRCINGYLKNKTRILVTHQQYVLPEADHILLLIDGRVEFQGSYPEFLVYSENNTSLLRKLNYDYEQTERPNEHVIASKPKDHLSIITEEKDSGDIPARIYLDFFLESFRRVPILLLYVLFCILMQSLFVLIQVWIAHWTSQPESEQSNPFYFEVLLAMVVGLFIGTFVRNLIFIQTLLTSCAKVYNKALNGVLKTFSQFFDANPSGRIINRFSRDTYLMDDVMTVFMTDGVQMSLIFFGYLVAMMIFVPFNIVPVIIFIVVVIKLKNQSAPAARELKRIDLVTRSPLFNWLNSGVSGIVQVRCFGWRDYFFENLQEAASHNMRACFHFLVQARYFLFFTDISVGFITIINAIIIVTWLGPANPDAGTLALTFSLSIAFVISYIGRDWLETEIGMTSVQRLYDYAKLPTEASDTKVELVVNDGKLAFYNVVMKYREHLEPALKGLSFEIEPRQKIGIVGRTGAGKSSIFQCLFRLVPLNNGCIMIDDQDISQVSLNSLRLQVGIIPQLPFVFYASLRKNLDPYDQYTDEEIWEALHKVGLSHYFENEQFGLYSMISATSISLSLGQRQLLCLARMILRRNKILLLDEATANVDNKTDEHIQNKVKEFFYASTVVCIAHRINTVIDSDIIIVMHQGRVGESGHPSELLKNPNSHFTSLVNELGAEESDRMIKMANSSKKLITKC